MKRILVVEDEKYMLNLLSIHLGKEFTVIEAKDGALALEFLKDQVYDLIILDVMLPYVDGWTICEKIREEDNNTPILMLTARHDILDKVKGFEIGADDYLVKPFEFEELKARVKALLRRSEQIPYKNKQELCTISFLNGLFILHLESHQLFVKQQLVELTAKEFDLLSMLASSPTRVFTREVLLDQIWEMDESRDLRIVDTHIKNIRTKLKKVAKDMKFIQTVWGVGYKFHEDMV